MMIANTNLAMPARAQNQNGSLFLFAAHTGSMVYNVSMAWYYNYLLKKAYAMGAEYTYEQIQTIKQEHKATKIIRHQWRTHFCEIAIEIMYLGLRKVWKWIDGGKKR